MYANKQDKTKSKHNNNDICESIFMLKFIKYLLTNLKFYLQFETWAYILLVNEKCLSNINF